MSIKMHNTIYIISYKIKTTFSKFLNFFIKEIIEIINQYNLLHF